MQLNPDYSSLHHVLICEDHHLVQLGLQVSLQKSLPQLKTLHIAGTAEEALQFAKDRRPDLALIDLGLPDMSGVHLIQQLQNLWPEIKVLVVTSCNNPSIIAQVLKLNVAGIMQKASSSEELRTALQRVCDGSGEAYLDPYIRTLLRSHDKVEFTPREYDVLLQIIQGHSNQDIANKIGCAITTVRFHRSNIMEKAGVHSATELAAWFNQGQRRT